MSFMTEKDHEISCQMEKAAVGLIEISEPSGDIKQNSCVSQAIQT